MGRSSPLDSAAPLSSRLRHWPWGLGLGLTVGLAMLIAGGALTQLLGVHSNDCTAPSTTEDLPATKLYCAQEFANRRTVDDLQEAMRLVNSIPEHDPLRAAGDRLLREWSDELLRLAEGLYQEGQLAEAIAAVRSIPPAAGSRDAVDRQVKQWQATWEKAEALYAKTQKAIDERQWGEGLRTARQILGLENSHWQTVKYPELMDQLDAARGSQESPVVTHPKKSIAKNALANRPPVSRSTLAKPFSKTVRPRSSAAPAPRPTASPTPLPVIPASTPPAVIPVVDDLPPMPALGDMQPVDSLPKEFELPVEASPSPGSASPAVSPGSGP
jgi:hypothetical protein